MLLSVGGNLYPQKTSICGVWRRVVPSEGSHATFAPRGWKQRALQEFAEQELGQHCEVEHVACGSGLERIYRFLNSDVVDVQSKVQHVRSALSSRMSTPGAPSPQTWNSQACIPAIRL